MDNTNDVAGAVPPSAAGTEGANLGAGEEQARSVAEGAAPVGLRPEAPAHAGSLAEAAALLGQRPRPGELLDGGPGVGAAQEAVRTEGFALRPIGTHMAERLREAEAVHRPLIGRDVLPRSDFAIDPDTVPGVRVATAAGQVRRNGKTYQARAPIPVDYRAYVELVRVGHILSTAWEDLPHHEG